MKSKLYIPKKIKAGFVERDDTFTKKLAYIVYYDEKGKLRKQVSWDGWRDHKIDPIDIDNEPHGGFILNKSITRFPWSSFGDKQTRVRVYDDRGVEFEITAENLLFILMHQDCNRRELSGKFVYAWDGQNLLLMPTQCEEYQESVKFTENKEKKISAKQLVPGITYLAKNGEDKYIYLGRFEVSFLYSETVDKKLPAQIYKSKRDKRHVFYIKGEEQERYYWGNNCESMCGRFHFMSSVSKLSCAESDEVHPKVAHYIEEFAQTREGQEDQKILIEPVEEITFPEIPAEDEYFRAKNRYFIPLGDNRFVPIVYRICNYYRNSYECSLGAVYKIFQDGSFQIDEYRDEDALKPFSIFEFYKVETLPEALLKPRPSGVVKLKFNDKQEII